MGCNLIYYNQTRQFALRICPFTPSQANSVHNSARGDLRIDSSSWSQA